MQTKSLPLPEKAKRHSFDWAISEAVQFLKERWELGESAGVIAERMTLRFETITRNAVIGKLARLGLLGGRSPARSVKVARPRPNLTIQVPRGFNATENLRARKEARFAAVPILIPVLDETPTQGCSLADLTDTMCHWPIGDPKKHGFHYCGLRKSRDVPGKYCEHHAAIAYRPSTRKPKPKGKNGFYWLDLAGRHSRNGGSA